MTVINYSSSAKVTCQNKAITSFHPEKIKFRGGGTDYAVALRAAYQEISQLQQGFIPVLLFMSDGGCGNGEKEIQQIRSQFDNLGLIIFVIGFGYGCSEDKLRNMAIISNGQYYFGQDAPTLKSEFEAISVKLSTGSFAL